MIKYCCYLRSVRIQVDRCMARLGREYNIGTLPEFCNRADLSLALQLDLPLDREVYTRIQRSPHYVTVSP